MFTRTTALTLLELKSAIVREPLVVSPDTMVMDAIAQMSRVRAISDASKTVQGQLDELPLEARSSCVLVAENGRLLGILTKRDVVQITAQQRSWENLAIREVMAHPVITLRESIFTNLFFAINLLQQHQIRHLPIVDDQNQLVGLVTPESLRQISRPVDLLRLRLVSEVMTSQVICATPDSSMLAIAPLEAEKVQLLENRNLELERQVETRTTALKKKAQQEKLITELAIQIRSSLSLQTILDTTVDQIRQVLGCDRVNIWQLEANGQIFAVAESTNSSLSLVGKLFKDTSFKEDYSAIYYQGYIHIVSDIYTAKISDCHRNLLISLQTRAKILMPILCGDRLWGLLNASESHHPRDWQEPEVELLQLLSVQLEIAIQQNYQPHNQPAN